MMPFYGTQGRVKIHMGKLGENGQVDSRERYQGRKRKRKRKSYRLQQFLTYSFFVFLKFSRSKMGSRNMGAQTNMEATKGSRKYGPEKEAFKSGRSIK
jgi:hypothetical protein